ncbi:MAG: AmmeMemoRadiSam system protein B [Candidatus Krumholzibacteriia bacterium]
MLKVRAPVLAGTWYPAAPAELAAAVRALLASAGAAPADATAERPVLTVVPHAGYAYSGPAAGEVYRRLSPWRYDRVFILAPSHRARLPKVSVSGFAAYATPLGNVAVDRETVARLSADAAFTSVEATHAAEHAEEIQLPFLQTIFGDRLRIVPLLVPPLDDAARRRAAAALAPWCDGRSLFLVSSDFTHYGEAYGYLPFREGVPERIEALDRGAWERILARDPDGLLAYRERTGITMCGLDAAALALTVPLPAGLTGELAAYARSGDRDRDYTLSVSYAGLILRLPAPPSVAAPAVAAADDPGAPLDADERRFLLALARDVVEATAAGRRPPTPRDVADRLGLALTPRLAAPRGAFVTLTRHGELRGCIGYIEGVAPLARAVAENAAAAAARDPRFPPVGPEETADLHVEVSALTPLRDVAGPAEIVIGRHGIVLAKGRARAVFLPQVAPEQGWDRDTTLRHLSLKAGLPPDGWRAGARFAVFEAEVLAEPEKDW